MKTYEANGFTIVDCAGAPEDAVEYALADIAFADCVRDVPIILVGKDVIDKIVPPFSCIIKDPPMRKIVVGTCRANGAFVRQPPRNFEAVMKCKMPDEVANAPYFVVVALDGGTSNGDVFKRELRSLVIHEYGHAYMYILRERARLELKRLRIAKRPKELANSPLAPFNLINELLSGGKISAQELLKIELGIKEGRLAEAWLDFIDFGYVEGHISPIFVSSPLALATHDVLFRIDMNIVKPVKVLEEFAAQVTAYVHLDDVGRRLMHNKRWDSVEYGSFTIAVGAQEGVSRLEWSPHGCLLAKSWALGIPLFAPYMTPLPTTEEIAATLAPDLCKSPCDIPAVSEEHVAKGPDIARLTFKQIMKHYTVPELWRQLDELLDKHKLILYL